MPGEGEMHTAAGYGLYGIRFFLVKLKIFGWADERPYASLAFKYLKLYAPRVR